MSVTVVDARTDLRPRAPINAELASLQERAIACDAHGILELALRGELEGRTAVVSSFGAESAVLLHLVAVIDPTAPILFLNTGKLFGESLRYRDRLQDVRDLPMCAAFRRGWIPAARWTPKVHSGRATPMPVAAFARSRLWPPR